MQMCNSSSVSSWFYYLTKLSWWGSVHFLLYILLNLFHCRGLGVGCLQRSSPFARVAPHPHSRRWSCFCGLRWELMTGKKNELVSSEFYWSGKQVHSYEGNWCQVSEVDPTGMTEASKCLGWSHRAEKGVSRIWCANTTDFRKLAGWLIMSR